MLGVVSRHFVAARDLFGKRASLCIQGMSLCHRNHFFFFRNEHDQSTTLGRKLVFGVVLCHFVAARDPFGKRAFYCIQGMSLCHQTIYSFFGNEQAKSTTLGPKLIFGVVSCHFIAARDTFGKRTSGVYKARVCATGTISSFFATKKPNPPL